MADPISRRSLLKSAVVVAGAGMVSSLLDACSSDEIKLGDAFFPQSLASGDPKADSVVLWTRVVDPGAGGDLSLHLQVSTDQGFGSLVADEAGLTARAAHDGCLKVKVTALAAGTTYYYRFTYTDTHGAKWASRIGRTRTARAAATDAPVRFAVLNCQDYIGRYWNTMLRLSQLDLDLDFVLAIGDYIYETVGDPSFQTPSASRNIAFNDRAGALTLGAAGSSFQAARSVDNYRQLYRTYRADRSLQTLHEKYPFIVTWDDHEYSDDCWGDVATYSNGLRNEKDTTRRLNAEQAFFEFMPIDDGSAGGVIDTQRPAQLYPNTKLWRNFTFGKNLELVMTDYRSFRPDHPVPEDGFPGTVVVDKATLIGGVPHGQLIYDQLPQALFAYVDIDDPKYALQRSYLQSALGVAYNQAGMEIHDAGAMAQKVVTGNLALVVVNSALQAAGAASLIIDPAEKDSASSFVHAKGLAFAQIGKQDLFTRLGSRYLTVKSMYELYTGVKYALTAKASENAWGDAQEAYVKDRLANSTASFKVLVSSVSMTPMAVDLSAQPVPALFQQDFLFDCDQWDGFPNKRNELIGWMQANGVKNTLLVCGDVHGGFASRIVLGAGNELPVVTAPAISSQTLAEELNDQAALLLGKTIADQLIAQLDVLLKASNQDKVQPVDYVKTDVHGFTVVEIDGTTAKSTMHMIPHTEVTTDYAQTPSALPAKFTTKAWSYAGGTVTAL